MSAIAPRPDGSTPAVTALRNLPGLRRAWPDGDRGLVFESRDAAGRLRAGRIDTFGRLELLPHAEDPALPDLSPRLLPPSGDGRLVVHRAGRRAVVLGTDRVRKLVRAGRAARLSDPHLARPFLRAGLRTAEVLDRSPSRVDLELLPGASLHDLGDAGLPGWERLAELWPGAVRPEALPEHTGADEAAVLRRWYRRAQDLGVLDPVGAAPEALADAVAAVCARLAEPGEAPAASHRDLHDGQLLWDGSTLSLLDLDTAALAEPALDLGNLAAHLDLAHAQGRFGAATHAQISLLLEDLGRDLADEYRLAVYYLASRIRLSFVHAFRPGTQEWLSAWTRESLQLASSPLEAWAARAPGE
ncbi:phosphotransferase [Actinomyces ruminicola]|uniref:Phosphotransferase enzyme family protein n=1 Tax=Actinomyces ruminicola TaxID=332524 RepID=A0A1G9WCI8_9ACTO|nr:phosphotransferase [Actinomyces ruminicola]SDM82017.1 Phosphotransferase enzyme family protein [Actinomyces ruminicola]